MTMKREARLSNAALMARRAAVIARGVGQAHEIFVERARDCEVWDVEGRRYIDFAGGIGVVNTGHCHPKVVAAVSDQLQRYTHTCFQLLAYEPYVELAERLTRLLPGDFAKKAMFLSTGAEAIENAIKIARVHTRRPGVIAFGGGFHGRTLMAMALTGKVAPYKKGFGPFPAGVFHAQFPNALHGIGVDQAMASVEHILKCDAGPDEVAALIIEPVQGEGGFYVAPFEFLRELRALCDRHGIVLIVDEIQSGAGRTGTWLAIEHSGVVPDLVTMAKSMAGGYPISAVLGRAQIMDAPAAGGLGGTYAGSPLGCAAALAVLDVFEEERLLERGRRLGQRLQAGLRAIAERRPEIGEVRGLGPMVAIELLADGRADRPDAELTRRLVAEAARRGLILLSCGIYANVIRILVPLTAPDALVDEALGILSDSLEAVAS
jgi:4-aminobutyrate aminotransferase / (S)-3-amino-2-methylpropionate transaminase / 5-aminovalerate transaminase